jgi:hypothetical protein
MTCVNGKSVQPELPRPGVPFADPSMILQLSLDYGVKLEHQR